MDYKTTIGADNPRKACLMENREVLRTHQVLASLAMGPSPASSQLIHDAAVATDGHLSNDPLELIAWLPITDRKLHHVLSKGSNWGDSGHVLGW